MLKAQNLILQNPMVQNSMVYPISLTKPMATIDPVTVMPAGFEPPVGSYISVGGSVGQAPVNQINTELIDHELTMVGLKLGRLEELYDNVLHTVEGFSATLNKNIVLEDLVEGQKPEQVPGLVQQLDEGGLAPLEELIDEWNDFSGSFKISHTPAPTQVLDEGDIAELEELICNGEDDFIAENKRTKRSKIILEAERIVAETLAKKNTDVHKRKHKKKPKGPGRPEYTPVRKNTIKTNANANVEKIEAPKALVSRWAPSPEPSSEQNTISRSISPSDFADVIDGIKGVVKVMSRQSRSEVYTSDGKIEIFDMPTHSYDSKTGKIIMQK